MKKITQEKIIAKTKKPITQSDIEKGLKELGVKPGDNILVHTSLSSFGFVIGAEVAIVRALINVVGAKGTIIVPSQSSENTNPEKWENPPVPREWWPIIKKHTPAYDVLCYNTRGMGRVPNLILQMKKSIRSNHPIVSFAAIGKNAKKICKNHALQPMLGVNSPLGKMYELPTKVLLLGVGYENCTCFHLGEVKSNKLKTYKEETKIYKNGKEEWISFVDLDYDNDDFEEIGLAMESKLPVKKNNIGNAACRCFDFKSAVDYSAKWIIKNR